MNVLSKAFTLGYILFLLLFFVFILSIHSLSHFWKTAFTVFHFWIISHTKTMFRSLNSLETALEPFPDECGATTVANPRSLLMLFPLGIAHIWTLQTNKLPKICFSIGLHICWRSAHLWLMIRNTRPQILHPIKAVRAYKVSPTFNFCSNK